MKITYKNWTFLFSQTESAKPTREQSLSCESISADTLTAVVRCNDPTIMAFAKNDPIRVWENDSDASMQTYYLRSITRTGATSYRLVAWSAVGLLAAMAHKGGIYTGQTVAEVVKEICGNVPVVVKSVFANTKLYGWLPYCQPKADRRGKSARDNLVQVLFAIGAYLTTDLNGVLHIDALWDGASSTIGSNRMYASGGKVSYSDPVSAVTVTEHQYIAGTDEKELFSGTSQQGDIITFSEPMHSLTATGFTLLESGANYAKISSGSGSLKGKTYIHNTRLVTQTVTENAAENVKSVTDATLVSLVNSSAVAKRLADYYKCRETITNGIVSGQEKPGHVVSVYHPYDKKMVSACIVSLDTTMSGTLKSEMAALVGFLPPQPETTEYYDERVLLTGSGEWESVIDGEIRVVVIGGGETGASGSAGSSAGISSQSKNGSSGSYSGSSAGQGGEGGEGGSGGKILIASLNVITGQKFQYAAAQPAGNSTFGELSSASGETSVDGYYDLVTQTFFGRKGANGIKGGNGGSPGNNGQAVGDYLGGYGINSKTVSQTKYGTSGTVTANGWGGGGAAQGANGATSAGEVYINLYGEFNSNDPSQSVVTLSGNCSGGGKGANGANGNDGENYGDGGGGGHGGGGAGAVGTLSMSFSPSGKNPKTETGGAWAIGGSAGAGGAGKPGCIIIYYRKKKELQSGPLVTSNNLGLLDSLGRRMIV
uniref:Uncharacterized protein n=1 Tax=Podoviridae sp. ctyDR6 TaxID=2825288 RepID=A0A8S5QK71_9CAUD|nr:MAG TPA: hypothetical protein [Podoviridae sp. ctyDR6]